MRQSKRGILFLLLSFSRGTTEEAQPIGDKVQLKRSKAGKTSNKTDADWRRKRRIFSWDLEALWVPLSPPLPQPGSNAPPATREEGLLEKVASQHHGSQKIIGDQYQAYDAIVSNHSY